jgi:rfaE bifunctional protein nucleotidyltransferase chain/domain
MDLVPRKLFKFSEACKRREELRMAGRTVVLTNGCFDVLHAGHVFSMENAKKFGDSLWVAMNSDASVCALKGNNRPIFCANMRAYVLSALEQIDGIFIFEDQRLTSEILAFKPNVYVKSGDYNIEKLDASELAAIREVGATIHFVPFLDDFSSTSIIVKILSESIE